MGRKTTGGGTGKDTQSVQEGQQEPVVDLWALAAASPTAAGEKPGGGELPVLRHQCPPPPGSDMMASTALPHRPGRRDEGRGGPRRQDDGSWVLVPVRSRHG